MENGMTKKNVFFVGLSAVILIVLLAVIDMNLGTKACVYYPKYGYSFKYCEFIAFLFFPLVALIPFSLITYKMKEEVFRVWWNFARWFVPVIIIVTFYFNSLPAPSGFFQVDISPLILGIFYIIFIFVSIVKIVRAYQRSK